MNRRHFLLKSMFALSGLLMGFGRRPEALAGADRPRLALIIDDIGHSRARAQEFLNLDVALTFSVLPHLTYSRELAIEMNRIGYEVMLHQPMEPYNTANDPGPGALFVGDSRQRIMDVMEANIENVPYAGGVNNHMGSKFTESREDISEALEIIKKNKLFFVDSCTSNHSKAHATARSFKIPSLSRRIFLDNTREESAVLLELARLKKCALRVGQAVGIGHPFMPTARAIHRFARDEHNADIELVSVSELLKSGV
ncbi:MAG: divergent polysaccharide deacetylase family protein [Deltaproteobacteria bacterium]|nr:divergent polysaccharide deacetylase family protein [Deltaproteobacteria bacterium]